MAKSTEVTVADPAPSKFKTLPTEDIIEGVIEELEALIVERGKDARKFTMLVMWETGQTLRNAERDHKVNISALVRHVASDNRITGRQMGERNLWLSLKFFDSMPVFEKVYETEHGENVSWTKIKKMLTTPKPKKEKNIKELAISLVERLGVDEARKLAEEIINECDKQKK